MQPSQTFPLTVERAWKRLMTTLAVDNVGRAQQMNIAAKGLRQIMGRR